MTPTVRGQRSYDSRATSVRQACNSRSRPPCWGRGSPLRPKSPVAPHLKAHPRRAMHPPSVVQRLWSRAGQRKPRWMILVAFVLSWLVFSLSSTSRPSLASSVQCDGPSLARCASAATASAPARAPLLHADPQMPRVVVLTVWTHYPEMMRWQVATLRVFLKASSMVYLAVLNSGDDAVNTQLAAMARSLGVSFAIPDRKIFGDVSDSHAKALNHGMAHLLRANNDSATLSVSASDRLNRSDILFLLDSDIFLTSPMDLLSELGGSHIWSVLVHVGDAKNITYLWPNFSVIHFAGLHDGDALLGELDWGTCQRYRGIAAFDSGGCTARFLDQHPEVIVAPASKTCTPTSGRAAAKTCEFLAEQNGRLPANNTRCAAAHTIERAGLDGICRSDPASRNCLDHVRVYHLGSAGSNWRGCSEKWLESRREDLKAFLGDQVAASLFGPPIWW